MAVVVDDCGHDAALMRRAVQVAAPLTFAIIPRLAHSTASAEMAHEAGHEVILHQPMEPLSYPSTDPGQGAILTGMGRPEAIRVVTENLRSIPHVAGLNNHMGSRATADPVLMGHVLAGVGQLRAGAMPDLYFLDSKTTAATVAYDTARRFGLPAAIRTTFLDNDDEDVERIRAQLDELLATARRDGEAIGIGHLKPTTLSVLEAVLPSLPRTEVQVVFASQLAR